MLPKSIIRGVTVIQDTLKTLTNRPGVYRMLGKGNAVLYVGKAKSLKKRVVSYTQIDKLPHRLKRMISETLRMEIVVTHTETEALLLESNLIKKLQPTYNILLKDDKAFPYLLMTKHPYPKMIKYRGKMGEEGKFFGPFASSLAVDETLINLQKVFLIRNCSDEIFKNRKRPCLHYYIKRCSAPCVGYIHQSLYNESCEQSVDFLQGKNAEVQKYISEKMQQASEGMRYEEAAIYRDRLKLLTHIQTHQRINVPDMREADVLSVASFGGKVCVQIFFFRHGSNYGTESFFLEHTSDSLEENFGAFIKQFYQHREPSALVLLSHEPEDFKAIRDALKQQHNIKTQWQLPKIGSKAELIRHATMNAMQSILRSLTHESSLKKLFEDVAEAFHLMTTPERIEIYDNSHLFGKQAYGVMVVATQEGLQKKAYRKFIIKNPGDKTTGGDDYAMMREVMERRFNHVGEEGWQKPDLLLIDGGLGQVNAVRDVLEDKGLCGIPVVGIAKGPDRNAGRENFIIIGREPFQLSHNSPTLHLLQRLRDEAHRFGLSAHRSKREKNLRKSLLDEIPGIGPARKKALLLHFGSSQCVARAALEDFANVPGIDKSIAKKIYQHFHEK
mgnify:CR=1 FL=1